MASIMSISPEPGHVVSGPSVQKAGHTYWGLKWRVNKLRREHIRNNRKVYVRYQLWSRFLDHTNQWKWGGPREQNTLIIVKTYLIKQRLTEFRLTRGAGKMVVVLSTLIIAFPALFTKVSWLEVAVAWSTYVTFPERRLLTTTIAKKNKNLCTPCRVVNIPIVCPPIEESWAGIFSDWVIKSGGLAYDGT